MFNITSNQRLRLKTKNKYCSDDITVVVDVQPALQSKTVTDNGTVTPDTGYYGMSELVVNLPMPAGNIDLTTTSSTNVYDYETAKVADDDLIANNIRQGATILGIAGTYDQPTMNATTMSISNDTISVSNPDINGNFVTSYAYKNGSTVLTSTADTSVDLSILGLALGSYDIGTIASGTNFHDSTLSNTIAYSIYAINTTISNGTKSGDVRISNTGLGSVQLTANDYWHLPDSITVSGVESYTYDQTTGVIDLTHGTQTVSITADCVGNTYPISRVVTRGAAAGATEIIRGQSATITITPEQYYRLPDSVSVENATLSSYDSTTGEIVLVDPIGDVTLTVDCPMITYTITPTIAHGTYSGDLIITILGTASGAITPNPGYSLPESIVITGANVHTYDSTTGAVTFGEAQTDITVVGDCSANTYSITATATNGTVSVASSITAGQTQTITYTPDSTEYAVPETLEVIGCECDYDNQTGIGILHDPYMAVTVSGTCLRQLIAPTVAFEEGSETVIRITSNDERATHYKIYAGDDYQVTIPISEPIMVTVTDGTYTGDTEITHIDNEAHGNIQPRTGYSLPAAITVTGTTDYTYDSTTGDITFRNATDDICVTAACEAIVYTITATTTNGTITADPSMYIDDTKTVTFTPNTGYDVPYSITCSGCTYTYNKATGVATLSQPTGAITISGDCQVLLTTPTIAYEEGSESVILITDDDANVTHYQIYSDGVQAATIEKED